MSLTVVDTSLPLRLTPAAAAYRLRRMALDATELQFRLRTLAAFLPRESLELIHDRLRRDAAELADLATSVEVGDTPIIAHAEEPPADGHAGHATPAETHASGEAPGQAPDLAAQSGPVLPGDPVAGLAAGLRDIPGPGAARGPSAEPIPVAPLVPPTSPGAKVKPGPRAYRVFSARGSLLGEIDVPAGRDPMVAARDAMKAFPGVDVATCRVEPAPPPKAARARTKEATLAPSP